MTTRNLARFLLQAITAGLAAALVMFFIAPGVLKEPRPVVELRQAPRSAADETRPSGPMPLSYADAVERAAPAVVNIYSAKVVTERVPPFMNDPLFRRFFGEELGTPRRRLQTSLGSGVIVSEDGYILTNNHVIEGADEIRIALFDGRNVRASKVGADPESDLAVLKVDLDALPTITLGDSEALAVGDVVLAIGNPFGVGQTVTLGIVSATGRSHLGINTFENFIQTDAAINPGNSGGALINPFGEVVGINTAIFSRTGGNQGIGFAIPASLAHRVMAQIIEHGEVIRGWLGVQIQDVTAELAESFGLDTARGAVIAGVLRDGPADHAGLRPGDVIRRIAGEPVADASEALNRIARYPPGSALEVTVWREGATRTHSVEVARRPPVERRR